MLPMPEETHGGLGGTPFHHAHPNIPLLDTPFPIELPNLLRVRILLQASVNMLTFICRGWAHLQLCPIA